MTLIVVSATIASCAQTQADVNSSTSPDNPVTYRLFPTQNMWTFIKLNTRNGQMWQVQYDVQGNNRSEVPLSLTSLIPKNEEANGRFFLYSTQNIYNFILLDQFDGRTWQVQWAPDEDKRGIIPIE